MELMIVAKDPSAVAAKWQQNASAATQSYKDGINSVTVAPRTGRRPAEERLRAGRAD